MRRLSLSIVLVALALALPGAALAQGGGPGLDEQFEGIPQEPQTTLPDVEDEVMCPICGVTLELATEAPQANQERAYIRELIAQGLTKEEIKDRLVEEFGPEVLALPDTEGFDLAAWLVPGIAIVIAAIGIGFGLRRWRREGPSEDDSKAANGDGLSDSETKRLDEDLARYEL